MLVMLILEQNARGFFIIIFRIRNGIFYTSQPILGCAHPGDKTYGQGRHAQRSGVPRLFERCVLQRPAQKVHDEGPSLARRPLCDYPV